ncbi:hypothetical protein [Novosphingobium cyanobacteriorum]|uniref:Uncharacterized protein n=1 Tax=Novosphingobium cyanobacteriorum TaxID=3024215 RepID=A0ABT6CF13_9SPHN|nr:hypothetical protein [Novosphingobium cyanobacteriorum]MDF8332496.1 hypothetical protein [Novosphingobium cyanobacteriorum]
MAAVCAAGVNVPVVAQEANGVGTQFELTFWQSVDGSTDAAMYEAYLAKYPDGTFAPLARAKISSLRKAMQAASAAPVAAPAAVAPVAPVAPVAAPRSAPVPQILPAAGPTIAPAAEAPRFAEAVPAPAPAAAPAPQPAPAVFQQASVPVQPAPQAMPQPAPVAAPATHVAVADAGNQPSTLGALLAALAQTQEAGGGSAAPARAPVVAAPAAGYVTPAPTPIAQAPVGAGFALPQRPQMVAVPQVALPGSFCSAEARNAFHDATYQPAVEAAKRNNDAAVAYMKQIQASYDSYQLSGDSNSMNALAAEAKSWQPVAADAYAAQAALVRQFEVLMAVPISTCGAPK